MGAGGRLLTVVVQSTRAPPMCYGFRFAKHGDSFQLTIRPASVVGGLIENSRRLSSKIGYDHPTSKRCEGCRCLSGRTSQNFFLVCLYPPDYDQAALSSLPQRAYNSRLFRTPWGTKDFVDPGLFCAHVCETPTGVWWQCIGELSESVNETIEQLAQ